VASRTPQQAAGRRPVQQQLAVVRLLVDEVERSLSGEDPVPLLGLREQLADELEALAGSIRERAQLSDADPKKVTP
jgi:hypothetical protein